MDDYRGKKVLVTGGLGFIGSNIAIQLVRLGASVTVVDNLDPTGGANYFNLEPVKNDVEIIEGDTCDLALMRRLVRGCTHVFNLAGHVSHIESMQDPFSDLRMNAIGPLTVLEACKKENREARVVYAGTRQSYGKPDILPVVENLVLKPVDVNGVNKMAGEWYHMVYQKALRYPHGLPATGEHVRPASAREARASGIHRMVHPPGYRRRGNPGLRRRSAVSRVQLHR